jgi:hypothetical protein
MKNKLTDLNNHLFAQLERLSEEDITVENLAKEIQRSECLLRKPLPQQSQTTISLFIRVRSVLQTFLADTPDDPQNPERAEVINRRIAEITAALDKVENAKA